MIPAITPMCKIPPFGKQIIPNNLPVSVFQQIQDIFIFFSCNYSVPQAEHERRPLERNTSESEATEQLQNLYKLEIILNDQENFCKHIDFFSCLFYPFSELGERMLRL